MGARRGPLPESTYYVAGRDARYPSHGGFMAYTHRMAGDTDIRSAHDWSASTSPRVACSSPTATPGHLRPARCRRCRSRRSVAASVDAPRARTRRGGVRSAVRTSYTSTSPPPIQPARRAVDVRLRRGQVQRPASASRRTSPPQRAAGQDGRAGRGLRLGVPTGARRPRLVGPARSWTSWSRWVSSTPPTWWSRHT